MPQGDAVRAIQAMNKHPEQDSPIKAEAAKMRRHKPLIVVFSQAKKSSRRSTHTGWPVAYQLAISSIGTRFVYVIFDRSVSLFPRMRCLQSCEARLSPHD